MFIFQAIIFTIVFCFFTIYKDYIINTYYRQIDEKKLNYIHPDNHLPMKANDENDQLRDWILEIHFIDNNLEIGGFYEQLLSA